MNHTLFFAIICDWKAMYRQVIKYTSRRKFESLEDCCGPCMPCCAKPARYIRSLFYRSNDRICYDCYIRGIAKGAGNYLLIDNEIHYIYRIFGDIRTCMVCSSRSPICIYLETKSGVEYICSECIANQIIYTDKECTTVWAGRGN
jgi:hypothetical protein